MPNFLMQGREICDHDKSQEESNIKREQMQQRAHIWLWLDYGWLLGIGISRWWVLQTLNPNCQHTCLNLTEYNIPENSQPARTAIDAHTDNQVLYSVLTRVGRYAA